MAKQVLTLPVGRKEKNRGGNRSSPPQRPPLIQLEVAVPARPPTELGTIDHWSPGDVQSTSVRAASIDGPAGAYHRRCLQKK